ncbi:MAG: MFS transporter, partial [Streptomyces sp.]|nr:MFS transporter [Streptomyces sp.]
LYNNVKTLGGAVAGGVMASVLAASASGGRGDGTPAESGYVAVWLLCAVLAFGAAAVTATATATARRR